MTNKIVNDIARLLPEDMLSEILKHAASNSAADFVNARLSCKAVRAASNYDQIFENVSMEKLNFVPWRKSEKVLQKRCEAAQNAEALYRKGMMDCFSLREFEFGLHCLKKAAEKGHVEAIYTYGIILICFGGELREQGLRIISSLDLTNSSKRRTRIVTSCRLKTENLLSNMWVYAALTEPTRISRSCDSDITERPNSSSTSSEGQAWEASKNVGYCCDPCFWDGEATLFCSLLRKYLIN
ncbi:hypothetical protein Golax_008040 [Gossypium laxum]|uniref:At2g35280-like TPR domain-containing protein n=1 Tax=Gossypium laxum TaxID=34288 RepID=A0A7J9A8P2_9ROSI|nr:hypothetical protein [Gossypium laxum]